MRMPEKKRMSLKEWRKEMESRRNEVLAAIRALVKTLFSGEDLKDIRLGQQLVEIGNAIVECGVTDEMVGQVVEEVRQEMKKPGDEDREEIARHFSNIVPYARATGHKIDSSPELKALRVKHAAKVVGGHAFAKKLAEMNP